MNIFKVKLSHKATNSFVEFEAAPDISESGSVVYRTIDPVHSPGGIVVFTNTSNRTFQLSNLKLFSRTREEATRNYNKLQIIKSWRYPSFGKTTDPNAATKDPNADLYQLGQPPAVLEFSAYSNNTGVGPSGLITKVPVVISNLSITYPTECDYITTAAIANDPTLKHIPDGLPMPVLLPVEISLMEAQTPNTYKNFSLSDFRQGKMVGF